MKSTSLLRIVFDFFIPRFCLVCKERLGTDEEDYVCVQCTMHMPLTNFYKTPSDNSLTARLSGVTSVQKASAYIYHSSASAYANITYSYKYNGMPRVARNMGRIMARVHNFSNFFDGIDYIVPVPLHPKKKRLRGYNQSELLAKGVSDVTGIPVCSGLLRKTKHISSLTQYSAKERIETNVDLYELTDEAPHLKGKHFLLVDDVVTTGSTTASCANALLKIAGAKVSLLAWSCVK